MKRVAILIDGGWFSKALGAHLQTSSGWPTADQVYANALSVLQPGEELVRLFYYDSNPYEKTETHPITKVEIDFSSLPACGARKRFLASFGRKEFVALRRGEIKFRGWLLRDSYLSALLEGEPVGALREQDVVPDLQQKGVDMRIGIDVATLAIKHQADRIILFSGDEDMIPAIKLARRESLQVFLVKVGSWSLTHQLVEDSDGVRALSPQQ